MAAIWSPEERFRIWFEIEAHAAQALADLGIIPQSAARAVWDKGSKAVFDIERIDAIEREVKHDVIAFLTHLAEIVGPEARFVHQGMTSSDVLDTCLSVQLKRAADILIADVDQLLKALKRRLRIQERRHNRPQPRHPCRAHHLRREARELLCRIRAGEEAADCGA
jgi:adenylosuccinate lyase